jgi:hypothetical protein
MINFKKYCLFLVVLVVLMASALVANAEMVTVTGKITGYTCLTRGYICPIDKADPMINLEKDFVLVTAKGDYYFMPNISVGLKARHALEVVTVTGTLNAKYKSIMVDTMSVGGKQVYSKAAEERLKEEINKPAG